MEPNTQTLFDCANIQTLLSFGYIRTGWLQCPLQAFLKYMVKEYKGEELVHCPMTKTGT